MRADIFWKVVPFYDTATHQGNEGKEVGHRVGTNAVHRREILKIVQARTSFFDGTLNFVDAMNRAKRNMAIETQERFL